VTPAAAPYNHDPLPEKLGTDAAAHARATPGIHMPFIGTEKGWLNRIE
jgi:hypothetical protein